MSTIAQGQAAEAAVLQALTAAGLHVLMPFGDGLPFDLVAVAPDGSMLRLQVKSGRVERVFMVPVDERPSFRGYLRLDPPRNNQQRRVRLAENYSFESWAESLAGPVVA